MTPDRKSALRRLAIVAKRLGQLLVLLLFAVTLAVTVEGWEAFGKAPEGERLARMTRSPQYADGGFENPQPLYNDTLGMFSGMLDKSRYSAPTSELPVVRPTRDTFATSPSSGLRVTWLGHSTLLIEIDGEVVLTDPVWGDRISPVSWAGPTRFYPPPIAIADLPELDAVLISHDHYDHLDMPTIKRLRERDVRFIVPLGVGAHLESWGVLPERIAELDWWQEVTLGELRIVSTPARHASGRTPFDQGRTLWSSYALVGPKHRVYFSGDTGLFPALTEIGERLGPFDVTLIESGAYGAAWPDWHLGPEQAVRAHRMVRGELLIPIHWGLFDLAFHGWTEPVERVLAAAREVEVRVAVPKPGESVEPDEPAPSERWWPDVPWKTGAQDPIVATKMDGG